MRKQPDKARQGVATVSAATEAALRPERGRTIEASSGQLAQTHRQNKAGRDLTIYFEADAGLLAPPVAVSVKPKLRAKAFTYRHPNIATYFCPAGLKKSDVFSARSLVDRKFSEVSCSIAALL